MLKHVSVVHSFLMLDNIPQYGSATFCLSIHLSMDVWVANGFLATVYE